MTRLGDDVTGRFDHGCKSSIGTTVVPLVSASIPATRGIQLKAASENTSTVFVGNADVTDDAEEATAGFPLGASEGLFVPLDDAAKIHLVAATSGQTIFFLVV
jgi:hypothetical protein